MQRTPIGINTLPLRDNGEPLSQEEYDALPKEKRDQIRERQGEVQAVIQERLQAVAQLDEQREEEIKTLAKEAVLFMIEPHFAQLKSRYEGLPKVIDYLDAVKGDVANSLDDFQQNAGQARKSPFPFPMPQQGDPLRRYAVNLLVDHSEAHGAPVVVEHNATYPNLFGSIERRVQMGMVMTDFTMIKPGSLHRANGGYLVLNANNLFRLGVSWEALKIAIKRREIQIEDPMQMLGYSTAEGLRPEPVPFRIKLIIIGSPMIYELLHHYDEDFSKLFNVKVDFGTEMDRTPEHEQELARFLAGCADDDPTVLPFTPSGVARMVEHAVELAGDQKKLSCQFAHLVSIAKEASYWARVDGAASVDGAHAERAIAERDHRLARIDEKIREMIARGQLFIDTDGERVGQLNGLAVLQLGEYAFAKPSRITATVHAGKGGIVDIEREAKLGGSTHSKGILILKGYLGERFAREKALSFTANLTFEQSYSMIDGDSASSAELYALLSALGRSPAPPGPGRDRLGEPARRDPADRRRQREDRRLLPHLSRARAHGDAGRAHPARQRRPPHAVEGRRRRRAGRDIPRRPRGDDRGRHRSPERHRRRDRRRDGRLPRRERVRAGRGATRSDAPGRRGEAGGREREEETGDQRKRCGGKRRPGGKPDGASFRDRDGLRSRGERMQRLGKAFSFLIVAAAVAALAGCMLQTEPRAEFTATPQFDYPPLDVTFNGAASTSPNGPIVDYAWDFGDGTTAGGVSVSHTYTEKGVYDVTLDGERLGRQDGRAHEERRGPEPSARRALRAQRLHDRRAPAGVVQRVGVHGFRRRDRRVHLGVRRRRDGRRRPRRPRVPDRRRHRMAARDHADGGGRQRRHGFDLAPDHRRRLRFLWRVGESQRQPPRLQPREGAACLWRQP